MKLLVIEDPANESNSFADGLRALGYTVDRVTDGADAIRRVTANEYQIIILDLKLPRESSLLVLHEIRETNREVEILMLSQQDEIHDRVTALIQGADDYLVKPLSAEDLHTHIQSLIKSRIEQLATTDYSSSGSSAHLNRLIANMFKLRHCEHAAIELVISEVRLRDLIERVRIDLQRGDKTQRIELKWASPKTPLVLIDVKWMEHMLAILLSYAISQCPAEEKVEISFCGNAGYCRLLIEYELPQPLSGDELETMSKNIQVLPETALEQPGARLALARTYADCMKIGLGATVIADNRLRIEISDIKLV